MTINIGEPIDPRTAPALCPNCFTGQPRPSAREHKCNCKCHVASPQLTSGERLQEAQTAFYQAVAEALRLPQIAEWLTRQLNRRGGAR